MDRTAMLRAAPPHFKLGHYRLAVLTKLDEWPRWQRAIDAFVPARPAAWLLKLGIPAAEASVVVCLLVRPRIGLIAASALLAVLALGVLVLRRSHAGARCNCFGAALEASIGVRLALRNALLAAVAGLAAVATPLRLTPLEILLAATGAALVLFGAEAYRFYKRSVEVRRPAEQ